MILKVKFPLVFGISFFWLGLVLAVSFLETPLKFQVPGMTLPIALELGKIMFGISTNIQLILLLIMVVVFMSDFKKVDKKILITTALLAIILGLEKLWMLPILDARADILATGKGLPPTPLHDYFIYAEVLKLLLLILLPIFLLERTSNSHKIKFNACKFSN